MSLRYLQRATADLYVCLAYMAVAAGTLPGAYLFGRSRHVFVALGLACLGLVCLVLALGRLLSARTNILLSEGDA